MDNSPQLIYKLVGLLFFLGPFIMVFVYLIAISRPGATKFRFRNFLEAVFEHFFYKATGNYMSPFVNNHSRSLTQQEINVLEENLDYYRRLPDSKKLYFNNRVVNFIDSIEIKGRKDFEVTREMELLIAGTAVQLTFGWRKYYLSMFKRIFVFPTSYYNRFTKNYHKGETNPQGVVVLSWDWFKKGIEIPDDNLNLGIHEFAHAVVLQRTHSPEYADPIFIQWIDTLSSYLDSRGRFKRISSNPYFRKYGQTNEMEFFAVATEAFFETPEEFCLEEPELYGLMCRLYNQNPLKQLHQ
ncbi:MAG: zinc-dependent peptidase [Schleiferiaceae bacterium]|nr:zinc-dependent peptidase [Schleiferiaceae bacterium]